MNNKIVLFLIFSLILSGSVSAVSVFYDRGTTRFVAEPGMVKKLYYEAYNNLDMPVNLHVYLKGDLVEYASVDLDEARNVAPGKRFSFILTLALPEEFEKPGENKLIVGVAEERIGQEGIGARGVIQTRVLARVRYPGKYITTGISAGDVQEGKTGDIKVTVSNYGTLPINKMHAIVNIYGPEGEKLESIKTNEVSDFKPDKTESLIAEFDTTGYDVGEYTTNATVFYDGEQEVTGDDSFRIGNINILIINNTKRVFQGIANPFEIFVSSRWNRPIGDVFAEVILMNSSGIVNSFKTPTETVPAWEHITLKGYLETFEMGVGEYDANVTLVYAGKADTKQGKVDVVLKPKEEKPFEIDSTTLIISVIVLLSVLMNIFWFLYFSKKRKKDES